jgi:hypothetical protein
MFELSYTHDEILLKAREPKRGWLGRALQRAEPRDLNAADARDRKLLLAIADLRALGEGRPRELRIKDNQIRLSHKLAASTGRFTPGNPACPEYLMPTNRGWARRCRPSLFSPG